ncbi:glycoside hydrolase family 15 protein [Artomyces pyxidatus]|uniref:Glycoside hydrolase family 15 protein n=1 Tax=Artomyces pyxidatus TaxID=48021 RepID=A0ACB8T4A4_9AGAM|nr:glycoside hydrolase family 15 protein [Artomyces pyxidatus]
MRLLFLLFSSVILASCVLAKYGDEVSDYITKQSPISEDGILRNTGIRAGAKPGVVAVATPVPDQPAYAYTWIRDAAFIYDLWLNRLAWGNATYRPLVDDAVRVLAASQVVPNPSGRVDTGGLAEPRFRLDLSPDLGPFARPENDGPPVRANVLIKYAEWLLDNDNGTWVAEALWPVINTDLGWVYRHWNESSFELWETIYTESFWTAAMQHRALYAGAMLGRKLGRTDIEGYEQGSHTILSYMQTFWDAEGGFMRGNTVYDRSGIDSAALLVSTFNYDPSADCDARTFQPCSDRALSSLKMLVDNFKSLYPVSREIPEHKPGPVGLFLEHEYGGGFPWYFTTFYAAQQLYDALSTWDALGAITVTPVSVRFFRAFSADVATGAYGSSSDMYRTLADGVRAYADDLVLLCAQHGPEDGQLPEGWDRATGQPVGATGLTWSYAASLTAFHARAGWMPAPWGARGAAGLDDGLLNAPAPENVDGFRNQVADPLCLFST